MTTQCRIKRASPVHERVFYMVRAASAPPQQTDGLKRGRNGRSVAYDCLPGIVKTQYVASFVRLPLPS